MLRIFFLCLFFGGNLMRNECYKKWACVFGCHKRKVLYCVYRRACVHFTTLIGVIIFPICRNRVCGVMKMLCSVYRRSSVPLTTLTGVMLFHLCRIRDCGMVARLIRPTRGILSTKII